MKSKKIITSSMAILIMFASVGPSVALASEVKQEQKVENVRGNTDSSKLGKLISDYDFNNLTEEQKNNIETYEDLVAKELRDEYNLSDRQHVLAGSLVRRLVVKYGWVYVTKTLPKQIYPKIAPIIGKKVSQATFVKNWGKIVGYTSDAAVKNAMVSAFTKAGIDKGPAKLAANIILTALKVFL